MDEALSKGEAPMTAEGQASQMAPAGQATDLSSLMAHGEMKAALGKSDAVLLSHEIGWVARYEGSWWIECERGWLPVADECAASDLDQLAVRLAAATGPIAQGAAGKESGSRRRRR